MVFLSNFRFFKKANLLIYLNFLKFKFDRLRYPTSSFDKKILIRIKIMFHKSKQEDLVEDLKIRNIIRTSSVANVMN